MNDEVLVFLIHPKAGGNTRVYESIRVGMGSGNASGVAQDRVFDLVQARA